MYNNVSEQFATTIRSPSRTFNLRLKINGKWIDAGFKKMSYETASTSDEGIQIGSAVAAKIELTVKRINELFENTEIPIEIGLKLPSGKYEYIPLGFFTAEHPTLDQATTTFTAYDRMMKTTGVYVSELTYPASAESVLKEISTGCGVPCNVSGLNGITIDTAPVGYTYREVIGYIASLAGGFACVDRTGTIVIKWYEDNGYTINESRIMTFEKNESNYHLDYLTCNVDSNTSFTAGSGTLGITFDNPLMTEEKLNFVYKKVRGFAYRGASLKTLGDIRLDPWDIVTVEESGETYNVPVMNITQEYDGGLAMTITAYGKTETETETDYKGPSTKLAERTYAEMMLTKELVSKKVDAEWVKANTVTAETIVSVNNELQYIKNNYLKSNEADIKFATIEEEKVIKSDIEQLNVKYEKVGILDGDVAGIKTLMFGSATGKSLTTEFANAVVSVIGDAQIKDAMIDSIAASKITALDLNTTKFKVHSEDGMSYWQDNTIIIKDSDRIRVQIGKDANSDYNMYVWDKSGNLMFDALGLTENGVKREIIRNDMIKENANIAASKLDIESLFNVINEDGSHTLKSSKIYVDVNKQTLDVAFKNMTTNVTELQNAVTTQGTQLTAVQGQISSKVWQQDIATAVNGLQIGGRNLFQNTGYTRGNLYLGWYQSTTTSHKDEIVEDNATLSGKARKITYVAAGSQGAYIDIPASLKSKKNLQKKVYTQSCLLKANKAISVTWGNSSPGFNKSTVNVSTEWQKFEIKTTVVVNYVFSKLTEFFVSNATAGTELYIADYKFEEGEFATPWTPAPEDTDSSISAVDTKVTKISNQYTSLNQSLTSLTAIVNSNTTKISKKADGSTVTALQANVTALTADLSGFKTNVSETYTSKKEFGDLKIGGRNLLLNTADLTKWTTESGVTVAKDTDGYFKIYAAHSDGWWSCQQMVTIEPGTTYMLSGYTKSGTKTGLINIRYYKSGKAYTLLQKNVAGRFATKLEIPADANSEIQVSLGLKPTSSGDYTYFKLPKLELGDKATDWSPAPEDTDKKFTEYSTTTQMNSAITQSANSVLTTVSSNYATKASLEVKIDKDKLISEINASADVITLKSNRFVLDSTNAKIAADGTVNFVQGTIAGWNISSTRLSGSAGLYGISLNKPASTSTKVININHIDTTAAATYVDDFYVRADGYTYIPDGYLSTKNHSVGGKGIEIYESQIKFYSWTDKDNFTGKIYTSYIDGGNSGSQNKRQALVICSDFNDELHLDYSDENRKIYTAIVIDQNADHKIHMRVPTVYHTEIQSYNDENYPVTVNSNFSVGKKGTEKIARFWCYNGGDTTKSIRIFNAGEEAGRYVNNCELSLWGTGRVQYNWYVNGTIYGNVSSDSDKNIKKDIQALDIEDSAHFIYSLIPSEFRFKNGTSNRLHHGLIAQEVKESMGDDDWGLFIDKKVDDENYNEIAINELTGEQTQLMTARYSLRYDELIADLIATVQSLNNRLKALEK